MCGQIKWPMHETHAAVRTKGPSDATKACVITIAKIEAIKIRLMVIGALAKVATDVSSVQVSVR